MISLDASGVSFAKTCVLDIVRDTLLVVLIYREKTTIHTILMNGHS